MSRPTKLTPDLAAELCERIREGNYLATAAALCGVSRSAVYRWLELGEAEDALPKFSEFSAAFTRARAETEATMVAVVRQDAMGGAVVKEVVREQPDGSVVTERQLTPPNGKLALEYLARPRPTEWRPVRAVELSGPAGGAVHLANGVDLSSLAEKVSKMRRDHDAGQSAEASA